MNKEQKRLAQERIDELLSRCIEEGDCLLWPGAQSKRAPMARILGKVTTIRSVIARIKGMPSTGCISYNTCGQHACIEPSHVGWDKAAKVCSNHSQMRSPTTLALVAAKVSATKRASCGKVTEEQRQRILNSPLSGRALARELGLHYSTVNNIRQRARKRADVNPWAQLLMRRAA